MTAIPTPLFLAYPRAFVRGYERLEYVDLAFFVESLSWRRDPLKGLLDIASDPWTVVEREAGDCVDFARLAAAWLWTSTDRPIAIYTVWTLRWPPGHAIVYDGERIYSNSPREPEAIVEEDIASYLERTGRGVAIRRRVRGTAGPAVVRASRRQQ